MAEEARRRKLPLWLRIALGVVVAIFTLVAAGVGRDRHVLEDMQERFISVPEQGGGGLIPEGRLAPGVLHTVAMGDGGMPGVYRIEIQTIAKEEAHWIDLYYSPYRNVTRKNISGFYQNPLGRFFLEDTVKN